MYDEICACLSIWWSFLLVNRSSLPPLIGLQLAQSSMAKPRLLYWEGDASLRHNLSVSSLRKRISLPFILLRPLGPWSSK